MNKTIPIEIVLQDPSDPIVPTPEDNPETPGESGTGTTDNTNASVPKTGDGTETSIDNNNSNFASSSAAGATIASTAILILAIVTSIVLVVRRYYKRKKANESGMTRQEKRAAIATSTIAVLAITVLLGQLATTVVVQPLTTNAAEGTYSAEPTYLDTVDKIQIVANRYDDVTIVATTKNISYATTDTSFGYKIFMSMAGEDANLYLGGDNTSEYYFTPTDNAGLDDNSWGYSLDGKANYTAMPLVSDSLMAQQTTSAIEDEEFTVYYAMKADKDMPFGVYSGEITYAIEGYNGFPSTLTSMQQMTSEICDITYTPNAFKADGVTIEDNVPTATLTDIRDNKTYTIAKLADGSCWMTQNLDLQKEDLLAGVMLDSTNTDNPTEGFVLPDSQVSGSDYWSGYDIAHVYDQSDNGQEYYFCKKYNGGHGGCDEYSEEKVPIELLGNYYNWYAATAGTSINTDIEVVTANGSICPAGWRLPSGSYGGEITDYSNLLYDYDVITSSVSPSYSKKENVLSIFDYPLLFMRAGAYSGGRGIYNVGTTGSIWSSLSDSYNAGAFSWNNDSVSLWDQRNKNYGYSVRCVAK